MMILVVEVTTMSIATSITLKKRIPEYIMGRILSIIQLCATISVPIGQLFYGICADCFPITFSFFNLFLWACLFFYYNEEIL